MRTIVFELDYGFRPTGPLFSEVPEEFRLGIMKGSRQLVLRRSVTPNAWYVVPTGLKVDAANSWPVADTLCKLDSAPDVSLLALLDESTDVVDYGVHMRAYIPMASTNAFDDQGMPLWSRYGLGQRAVTAQLKRRVRAKAAVQSFSRHEGRAPCKVSDLSDEAIVVLTMGGDRLPARPIWMYRSLASAVLELVRAGCGVVLPEGRFEPNQVALAEAWSVKAERNLCLSWSNPPSVDKRLEAYRRNPRRHFTNFKGKPPELAFPI